LKVKDCILNTARHRHHTLIGYEKEYSRDEKELIHKYSSTSWIQIEAGMAYQAGLPLLILKGNKLYAEGLPEPFNKRLFHF
jgi:hypothetical protein